MYNGVSAGATRDKKAANEFAHEHICEGCPSHIQAVSAGFFTYWQKRLQRLCIYPLSASFNKERI